MSLAEHHILALILTAITTFVLGLLVFLTDPKRTENRTFALYSACLTWWAVNEIFLAASKTLEEATRWRNSEWIGVCFIAPTLLNSVFALSGETRRFMRVLVPLGYAAGALFLVLRYFPNVVVHPLRPVAYLTYAHDITLLGSYLPIVFGILVMVAMHQLWRLYRQSTGTKRTQFKLLFWSTAIGYIGGSPDWLLAMGFYIPILNPFGIYGVPLYSIAVTYAVLQHRLFDVHVVIRKSLVYFLLTAAGYFSVMYVLKQTLPNPEFFLFHYRLSLFITAGTSFLLGALILVKNIKNTVNRTFAAFIFSVASWAATQALIGTWRGPSEWLLIARIEHSTHVFIPSLFLHFVHAAMGKSWGRRLAISYLISCVFLCFVPTRMFIWSIDSQAIGKYAVDGGPIYTIYVVWFVGTVLEALWKLHRAVGTLADQPMKQLKLRYLFWATIIGYAGALPNFLYVFDINVYPLNPFGTYLVPVFPIVIGYSIVKHQVLDISIVVRRSLVYSLIVTILTVGYFGLVYWAEQVFRVAFGYQSFGLSLTAFALMALVFQPLKTLVQRFVEWLFFHAPQEELVRRLERLEYEAMQGEKLKAVATLAAGMAHEIKNPLSSIKTFAEYLPKKYDDPEFREKFARIMSQEVGRINDLVQRLLVFAKPNPAERKPAAIAPLIDETLELLHDKLLDRKIQVARAYAKDIYVLVDTSQIKQVFLNILLNSIEAMDKPGCITVSTVTDRTYLDILVTDTGPGISKHDLPRVFEPFFTRKQEGTGLGLSVVHSIVQEHGGEVSVDSDMGRGTTVHIRLPITHTNGHAARNGHTAQQEGATDATNSHRG